MRRLLTVLLVVCLCLVSLGGVLTVSGFFADTDSRAGGTVQAGVLDIKLSEVGPTTGDSTTDERQRDVVHDTFEESYDARFDFTDIAKNTLRIDNTESSLAIERIGLVFSYTESDQNSVIGNGGNAKATAKSIQLTQFTYKGTDLLGTVIQDENGNGIFDVDDLTRGQTKQNLTTLSGIPAGKTANLTIELTGIDDRLPFDRGDGIDIILRIQGSNQSFTDDDASIDNTFRYE